MDSIDLRSDVREVVSEELDRFGGRAGLKVVNTVADYNTPVRFWIQIVVVLVLAGVFALSYVNLPSELMHLAFTLVAFQLMVYAIRSLRRIVRTEKLRDIIRR